MLISERIYKYMKERNMTQLEFAHRTGISQSTISDWRRKGTNPSADKIMIICEALEISPYELLLDTENQKMKEYQPVDYVVVKKDSREYELIEAFQKLNMDAKSRMECYLKKLSETE